MSTRDENYEGPSFNPYEDSIFNVRCSKCDEWSNPEEGKVSEGELVCVNCLTDSANATAPIPQGQDANETGNPLRHRNRNPISREANASGAETLLQETSTKELTSLTEVLGHLYEHFQLRKP